ncbi:MAG TPA: HAD-IC family P-type ATPase [Candidatus Dormibacteraeota bacterium]|nr:HAD-IC family P-type ATPase [Candidatus Dormibacteraeota bacterium]
MRRPRPHLRPGRSSRSWADILRANLLTRFNALLGGLLVVVLVIGPLQDAFFGLVLIANVAIGLIQEARAKIVLDRLSILTAPVARVIRTGRTTEVPAEAVEVGDLVRVGRGDQVVVDGVLVEGEGLEVDESALTGESQGVLKGPGDPLRSGSFVLAGNGTYRAMVVGEETFAGRLTAAARRYRPASSELRSGIDRILLLISFGVPPLGALLIATQLRAHPSLPDALRASVAGLVTLVPEGLVLLTSLALAVGIVRLGRRQVLVQDLAAVETLARVDVICLDKTGTLTDGWMVFGGLEPLADEPRAEAALGALAAADPEPNPTLRAVARAIPSPGWPVRAVVPFASARRWSGADFGEHGAWLLGAPEVLGVSRGRDGAVAAERLAERGDRVLVLARAPALPGPDGPPAGAEPVALVAVRERLRDDARAILGRFAAEGVDLRLLSGDGEVTVAAVARAVGLDPDRARGRVDPEAKRREIERLRARGHVVAMIGDGVNDIPALRAADLGVTLGSASPAARAVAQVVLLDSRFAGLPAVLAEGRRVVANVERLAVLFTIKTVYAAALIVATGLAVLPFPFLPRQLTLVGAFTIGIPAFFLALAPNARRSRRGFLRRTALVSVPAGLAAAAGTFGVYWLALDLPGGNVPEARTAATYVLSTVGLWVLLVVARPLTPARVLLVVVMVACLAATLILPLSRRTFALELPSGTVWAVGLGVVALTGLGIELAARLLRRPLGGDLDPGRNSPG